MSYLFFFEVIVKINRLQQNVAKGKAMKMLYDKDYNDNYEK